MNKISADSSKARFIFGSNTMTNSSYDIDDMFDMGMAENSSCNNDCANCMMECPYKDY